MSRDDKLVDRLDELIAKGETAIATYKPNPPNVIGFPTLDEEAFTEWRTQSLSFLVNLLGREHVYVENFEGEVERGFQGTVRVGIGILRAVQEDLRGGYLVKLRTLVSAEVFTDFLEIAEHLLENGYKDPAASLCGAVLEDGLRHIAMNAGVKVRAREDLNSLSKKCADAGVFSRLEQKRLAVWADIRNSADHGDFKAYTTDNVLDMHRGVTAFLAAQIV